ncbi:cytochrome P450 [Acidicapsa ligni]|uniref:cytochrome P450 n=1 Tax=Acidicapsa ligni TaxID=542300 RepID=UPI0021DF65BB|nr:cytochrome P450 [Acidicapsa ligni]
MPLKDIPTTSNPAVIAKGKYRFPPGLRWNLPFYFLRRFFRPGNPILLFEYLSKFGRAAHYRLFWHHILLLNDPSDIREVLVDKAQFFIKERTQKRMKILLGEGLITSDGETHKRHRRIAAPAFHRQRIQAYAETIVSHAAAMRTQWSNGKQFDAASEMMRLALQITARTLFDTEVTAEIHTINDEANAVMEIYNALTAMPNAELLLKLRVPVPVLVRFRKSKKRLDSVVDSMIARKQAEIAKANAKNRAIGGDLLSMLIAARDEEAGSNSLNASIKTGLSASELRDEVLTIFLAGYETVANALSWTWLLLGQNPESEARLHAELDTVLQDSSGQPRLPTLEDYPRLPYTEMVVAEAMRLYPPAWAMGRQATQDIEIGPYRIPRGSFVFFSQYIVQRNPKYFPDPLEFRPERFTAEAKASRPKFAYFPFGGGGRQCIGESFAWMEAVLVLATLAQRWRLRIVENQPIELQPKITLRPKFGIQVIPELRR